MSSSVNLQTELSRKTQFFGLKLWVVIGICFGVFIMLILCLLSLWVILRRKARRRLDKYSAVDIPDESKEIRIDRIGANPVPESLIHSEKLLGRSSDTDNISQCSSLYHYERGFSSQSGGDDGGSGKIVTKHPSYNGGLQLTSPMIGLPEFSQLGWGHWFTLRDLELATGRFSAKNVIGEGGYGVVYKGLLVNGTEVAVKKILNNLGQAEKEFRVEVEAIGHVRHKNLVRLLGYCIEGIHRMLVYEFVNNGNLEQWLHGAMKQYGTLTWEARLKVLLGTAKALSYLHEAIEPKVVHRDIKSSNILIDQDFNSKVSDFGLAKLLCSEESHVNTRVMGTFGYVAPEYAYSGKLNEKSDVYSFGVLFLETITGREPVDYGRPKHEVNLVEWLKVMVGAKRAEEVTDPDFEVKPSARHLKRALLIALKCVDPDSDKRPKMSQVVQMLEEFGYGGQDSRDSKTMEVESTKEHEIQPEQLEGH